jgi:hypothetical protein
MQPFSPTKNLEYSLKTERALSLILHYEGLVGGLKGCVSGTFHYQNTQKALKLLALRITEQMIY